MKIAQRIETIPPYLFAEIDRKKEEAIKRGVNIINLGIGDPDQPTPNNIIEKLGKVLKTLKHMITHPMREQLNSGRQLPYGIKIDLVLT